MFMCILYLNITLKLNTHLYVACLTIDFPLSFTIYALVELYKVLLVGYFKAQVVSFTDGKVIIIGTKFG